MINKKRLLFLLALLSAFPPLSTDMYLPAIPILQKTWQQPLSIVNLTLVGFFVSYCFFILFYGPISDRFGRRPPLLVGIGIFIIASLLCSISDNIISLIIFRVLQAAGAASASALALAISKDVYQSHERERVLACVGVIMAMAPMLAPVFGGWMLAFVSWRWVFVVQGLIATIAWIGVYRMPETLKTFTATGPMQTAGIYLQLLRNRRYLGLAILISLVVLPHFAFIGGAADIYITRLGMSEQTFGYFFAMNAMAFMAGTFSCMRLLKRFGTKTTMTIAFSGIFIGGLLITIHPLPGAWGLAIPMLLVSFSGGLSRPPSNNLVLEQVDQHAGSASSLMIFIFFMLGAFSMWLISLNWSDKIQVIGLIGALAGGSILVIWVLIAPRIDKKSS